MTTRLLILPCSNRKCPDAGVLPASERYTGMAYQVLAKALREGAPPPEVLILSAEYGLITPETPIPTYNHRMTPDRATELMPQIQSQWAQMWAGRVVPPVIHVHGGAVYRDALRAAGVLPPHATITWASGGIGTQLGQLKAWLRQPAVVPPQRVAPRPAPRRLTRWHRAHEEPPPSFYFSIGSDASERDLEVALAAGQRHFLVPAGTPMAHALRYWQPRPGEQDIHVLLDSNPFSPQRLSLRAYQREICRWLINADGSLNPRLDAALSYDHVGDAARSRADHARLMALPVPGLMDDLPIIPVVQYPTGCGADMLGALRASVWALDEAAYEAYCRELADGIDPLCYPTTTPAWAVGGLARQRYAQEAEQWLARLLVEIDDEDEIHPAQATMHMLGIGRPTWLRCSPLIRSFDSAGPVKLAAMGMQKVPSTYAQYGFTRHKLEQSREARLALHLIRYAAAIGRPWSPVEDESVFYDDSIPLCARRGQRSLPLLAA